MSLAVSHELISCPWRRERAPMPVTSKYPFHENCESHQGQSNELWGPIPERYCISLCLRCFEGFALWGLRDIGSQQCIVRAMLGVETRAPWEIALVTSGRAGSWAGLWIWMEQMTWQWWFQLQVTRLYMILTRKGIYKLRKCPAMQWASGSLIWRLEDLISFHLFYISFI